MIPVAQVCLVLSVRENGPDWQLTQIKLQGCEISRTLDRLKTDDLEKSRILVVFWVQHRAGSRSAAAVCLVRSNAKNQFRAGGPLLSRTA